ncbi:hypothetical protein [Novosphingobium sp.]|uniref:hypothetical protein n=1 Tax=Novosphingobium sp. TaxID=1874826 RepID=UPI002607CB14|nr:hypothetical protein [Novosphingobium sp.]
MIGLKCAIFSDILQEISGKIARAVTSYDCEPRHFKGAGIANPGAIDPIDESSAKLEGFRRCRPISRINTCKMNRRSIASMLYLELSKNGLPDDEALLDLVDRFSAGDIDDMELAAGLTDAEDRLGIYLDDYFEEDSKGEWLKISSDLSDAYMTGLANKIGSQMGLVPITNQYSSQGLSARLLFEDYVEDSHTKIEGCLITIFIRSINIDPSVRIDKILKFREKRFDQINNMHLQITEIVEGFRKSISDDQDDIAVMDNVRKAYARKIEPELAKLKSELDRSSIGSTWEGCYRALTLSVPSAGAIKYFTDASTPLLLGAGMALGFTDIAVKGYLAQRRTRESNPYTYLYDAHRNFGLPTFEA